ncbi:hypothetical protein MiSe_66940 [Microseira wollei NIES-4236]|uniref:Uncharacterized protein n=1 Tax=Microseira wollei NIES-4236 TaxID=2530354 RepID=A0AAV3XLG0_9CYAN|nr:hypothetical protein MiSe_66940 [Microseira wollei NIES-4236]
MGEGETGRVGTSPYPLIPLSPFPLVSPSPSPCAAWESVLCGDVPSGRSTVQLLGC